MPAPRIAVAEQLPSLEELAFKHGTDKSHDDHKYVDLYSVLFDPIRSTVRNVTEVGVATGQSLLMWEEFFFNADIYGIDIHANAKARSRFVDHGRIHHFEHANSQDALAVAKLRTPGHRLPLAFGSMDVIVDDGDHRAAGNQRTLNALWPYLRPGGIYCIEDIPTGTNSDQMDYNGIKYGTDGSPRQGFAPLLNTSMWTQATKRIFHIESDTFFVDTSAAHRNFELFLKRLNRAGGGKQWARDIVNHNSHVLVIRKRFAARAHHLDIKVGAVAMHR